MDGNAYVALGNWHDRRMPLHLTLELAPDMTIGELYAFVDQARGAGVPADAALEIDSEDHRVALPDLKIDITGAAICPTS